MFIILWGVITFFFAFWKSLERDIFPHTNKWFFSFLKETLLMSFEDCNPCGWPTLWAASLASLACGSRVSEATADSTSITGDSASFWAHSCPAHATFAKIWHALCWMSGLSLTAWTWRMSNHGSTWRHGRDVDQITSLDVLSMKLIKILLEL